MKHRWGHGDCSLAVFLSAFLDRLLTSGAGKKLTFKNIYISIKLLHFVSLFGCVVRVCVTIMRMFCFFNTHCFISTLRKKFQQRNYS